VVERAEVPVDHVPHGSFAELPPEFRQVTTASADASCGSASRAHERYLVFAKQRFVSLCSRTTRVAEASDDLRELGPARAPIDVAEVPTPTPILPPPWSTQCRSPSSCACQRVGNYPLCA
jgi:hypothetical protein